MMAILENAVAYPEDCPFLTLQQGENRYVHFPVYRALHSAPSHAEGKVSMCSIFAPEVLLSALEACGVDNARIEIEGNGEVPLYDGSATGFVYLIKEAGLRIAPELDGSESMPKNQLAPHKVHNSRSRFCSKKMPALHLQSRGSRLRVAALDPQCRFWYRCESLSLI